MKKWIPKLLTYTLFALVVFQVASRLPSLLRQYQLQGTKTPSTELIFLDLKTQQVVPPQNIEMLIGKKILVFWATWCGPCTVELSRLNALVVSGRISPGAIIAISSHEDQELVTSEAVKRGYQFQIALDPTGIVADSFDVQGTPTVIFLDEAKHIDWMTTGISPTLEMRSLAFLENENGPHDETRLEK